MISSKLIDSTLSQFKVVTDVYMYYWKLINTSQNDMTDIGFMFVFLKRSSIISNFSHLSQIELFYLDFKAT